MGSAEMRKSIDAKYDIGDKRSLEQYGEFCGIDIINKKELFSWCTDYRWIPYSMSDKEINHIRRFGNPSYFRREAMVDDDDTETESESVRGFIGSAGTAKEKMIYREIVGEIEHWKHSSWMGKAMHIVVLCAFLTCFVWCAYHIFRKSSPKSFGDKQQ